MAQATPAGYRQTAALPVLEAGGYTAPSYAAGRIFVRNLTELAAVRVGKTSSAAPAVAASAAPREDDFPDFLRALAAAEDASAAVEAFLDAQENWLSGQEVELVVGEELASPPGYRSWRQQVPAILAFLLGAAGTP